MKNLLKVVGIGLIVGMFLFGGIKNARADTMCIGSYDVERPYVPAIGVGIYQKNGKYMLKVTNPVYGKSGSVWPTGSEDVYYELQENSYYPQVFDTKYVSVYVQFADITQYNRRIKVVSFYVYQLGSENSAGGTGFIGGWNLCPLVSLEQSSSDVQNDILPATYRIIENCSFPAIRNQYPPSSLPGTRPSTSPTLHHSMYLIATQTTDGTYEFTPHINYNFSSYSSYPGVSRSKLASFKQNTQNYEKRYTAACGSSGILKYYPTTKQFDFDITVIRCGSNLTDGGGRWICTIPSDFLTTEVHFDPIVEPCGASITVDTTKYAVSTAITKNANGDRIYTLTFTNYAYSTSKVQNYTLSPNGSATTISVGCAKLTAKVEGTDVLLDLTADDCNTNKTFSHICPFPEETTIPETTFVSTYIETTDYESTTTDYTSTTTGYTTTSTGYTTTTTPYLTTSTGYTTTTPYPTTSTGYTTTESNTTELETTVPQTTIPEETQVNWGDMCDDFCDAYGEQYGW